ncbi:MAG: hypothetical protein JSR39_04845 [Verrucomicrobia bacterium]|nr:hypothetical protein [Verrucomicrobiota bacterium]
MATVTTNTLRYSAGEFSNLLRQNPRFNLLQNQALQITGIDQEACLEPTRVRPEERLDAIERVFNRVLQDQQLRIDDINTDGSLRYNVFAPGSFSILSDSPLEIRARPWDVAIAFRSLFDPNRQERNFRFLPNQQVIFTDLNSRQVTWAGNSGLSFWLSNYLRDQTPQGFAVDITGNQLVIGASDSGTGLALTDDAGLHIRVRRTGATSDALSPAPTGSPPQATHGAAFYDTSEFEEAMPQSFSSDAEESCTDMLSRWVSGFFSSISSFFSSLFSCLCCKSSE